MLTTLKVNHESVVYAGKRVNDISHLLHTSWGLRGKPKGEVTLTNKKIPFYWVKSNLNYVWDIYLDKYCLDSKVLCRILLVREEGCPDIHIGGGVGGIGLFWPTRLS